LDGKRSNRCPVLGGVFSASEAEQGTPGTSRRDHAQALDDQKKQLSEGRNKAALARALGVSRASLYYVPRMKEKDWRLKVRLEEELQIHPSYGSRRLARALGLCRQRAQRVMRLFGTKPYRRRGRKWRKSKVSRAYPNLLLAVMPAYANHIWAGLHRASAARKEGLCGGRARSLHPPDPGNPSCGEKGSRAHHSGAFQRPAPSSAPGSIPLRQREGV